MGNGLLATQPETSVPDKHGAGWPALVIRRLAHAAVCVLDSIDFLRLSTSCAVWIGPASGAKGNGTS